MGCNSYRIPAIDKTAVVLPLSINKLSLQCRWTSSQQFNCWLNQKMLLAMQVTNLYPRLRVRSYTPLGHKLRIFILRKVQFPGTARQGRCVTGGIIYSYPGYICRRRT